MNTGYVKDTEEKTKLRNEVKSCFNLRRQAHANFVTANAPNEWDYWTNRIENAIRKYREAQQSATLPVMAGKQPNGDE